MSPFPCSTERTIVFVDMPLSKYSIQRMQAIKEGCGRIKVGIVHRKAVLETDRGESSRTMARMSEAADVAVKNVEGEF